MTEYDYTVRAERTDLMLAYVQQSGLRDMSPMEKALYRALVAAEGIITNLNAVPEPEYEYAVKTLLITNMYNTKEEAEFFMRVLDGINPNARLVRRVVAGEWEEVND